VVDSLRVSEQDVTTAFAERVTGRFRKGSFTMKQRVLLFCLLLGAGLQAQPSTLPPIPIGIEEKLGAIVPLDQQVYDEKGNLVTLRSLISKPTILTFVYYRCPGICSPLLTELSKMVEKMDLVPGKDYQIITISFDHREKPELALEKQENYLSMIERPISPAAWHFLTADSVVIQTLTASTGFYFQRSGNDWIHAGALIFISPEGKVSRYFNGIQYLPFDVKMAIIEASEGRTGPTIAKVLRLCYSYDPQGRTYALNITRIAMVVTLLLVGTFVVIFILYPKKKKSEVVHGHSS
jgi:protein SCO1